MAEFQTTIQDATALLRGSGKVEVARWQSYPGGMFANPGDGGPEWFDVGAISELKVEEDWDLSTEEYDNVESVDRVNKQTLKIAFNQYELASLDVWKIMRESLDTITDTSDSYIVKSGNQSELQYFLVRITTKNDSKPFYLIGYKCNLTKGFNFAFKKDDGDDRRVFNPIEIVAKADDTYQNGLVYEMEFQGGV